MGKYLIRLLGILGIYLYAFVSLHAVAESIFEVINPNVNYMIDFEFFFF